MIIKMEEVVVTLTAASFFLCSKLWICLLVSKKCNSRIIEINNMCTEVYLEKYSGNFHG